MSVGESVEKREFLAHHTSISKKKLNFSLNLKIQYSCR